ncbi:MAG TPA: hypothetical protein DER58_12540 [Firmicutes bacterium]|jgi:hypothetical protein|nr:hypothetical protein [Bacillota bacterium]HCF93280.1 hypothetical protein [Bacillota bacterium]
MEDLRMRKVFLVLLIGIVCTISGCGGSLVAVSGTVRGTQENTVIAGALITATGKDTLTTVTGSDGTYQLMLPSGKYEISAAYQTFKTASATVTLEKEPVTKNFGLSTGSGKVIGTPDGFSYDFELITLPYGVDSRSITATDHRTTASAAQAVFAKNFNNAPEGYCYELHLSSEFAFTDPLAIQGFRLYSAHSADGPFVLVDAAPANLWGKWANIIGEFRDPLLFGTGESYYAIQLYTAEGETPLTEPVALVPLEPLTLKAPANNIINHESGITLEWNPVAGCSFYGIRVYKKQIDNSWTDYEIASSTNTSLVLSGLSPGEYLWRITAIINAPDPVGVWSKRSISAHRAFEINLTD